MLFRSKRIDFNISQRVKNLDIWLKHLDSTKYYTEFDTEGNSNFALPLVMNLEYRNKLKSVCEVLEQEKVEYRLGTAGGGNQAFQPYLKKYTCRILGELDTVDYIHKYSLYIGNHTDLTSEQIINLCNKLNNV